VVGLVIAAYTKNIQKNLAQESDYQDN